MLLHIIKLQSSVVCFGNIFVIFSSKARFTDSSSYFSIQLLKERMAGANIFCFLCYNPSAAPSLIKKNEL